MRLMKRTNIYKASNVTFNPTNKEAISYNWWSFVKIIDGKLVFNNYRYSPSTGKHQHKVRSLLNELGIKINLELSIPKGLQSLDNLEEAILEAEEFLCERFFTDILKRQSRYERTKRQKLAKKLTDYLETDVCFRDYEIKELSRFGSINTIAVHQVVEAASLKRDVKNALHSFHRDGFGSVVFYV